MTTITSMIMPDRIVAPDVPEVAIAPMQMPANIIDERFPAFLAPAQSDLTAPDANPAICHRLRRQ